MSVELRARPAVSEDARRAAQLGDLAQEVASVELSWKSFAVHAHKCGSCAPAAQACRKTGLQSDDDRLDGRMAQLHGGLCPEGRPLFEAWRFAVGLLKESWRR